MAILTVKHWMTVLLLPVLLLAGHALPASAARVTFYFQGTLSQDGTAPHACGNPVSAGTAFTGHYTVETTTPDSHPSPQQAIHTGAVVGSLLELAGTTYGHAFNGSLQFQDNYSVTGDCDGALHDQFNVSLLLAVSGCTEIFTVALGKIDCTGTLLSTAASISTQPPDPSFLPFPLFMAGSEGSTLVGSVDSISLSPTPVRSLSWGGIKALYR